MSTRRQISPSRLLITAAALGLAAWVAFSLLPRLEPAASPAHEADVRSLPALGSGANSTRVTAPLSRPRRAPRLIPSPLPFSPLAAARDAYGSLRQHFAAPYGLLTKYADETRYAGAWSLAQAMDAATALDKAPDGGISNSDVEAYFSTLRLYWDPAARTPAYDKGVLPPLGPGGHKFYDDNALVGLALIRGYGVTRDPRMLHRAQQIFDFEKTGWDRNPAHPYPGGVFWKRQFHAHDRNTVSTAGAAELGLHLYLLTGNRRDLSWARRMYGWVNRIMRSPTGLYWDHVGLAGRIDRKLWSYNQGLMIGNSALLYRATGRRSYLRRARVIADASVSYFRVADRLTSQRPIIDAIYIANLLSLDRLAPNPAYLRLAERYAAFLNRTTDRATGVLAFSPRPFLLDQAALVQVDAYVALARHHLAGGRPVHHGGGPFQRKLT